jgi:DNA-binding cell septation regulator SpoVG
MSLPLIPISSVRIQRLYIGEPHEPLRGFANAVLAQQFLIRRLKIVQGDSGLLIYSPSTNNETACPYCTEPNPLRFRDCQWCGRQLPSEEERVGCAENERVNRRTEHCHPVDGAFRDHLKAAVLAAFRTTAEAGLVESCVKMHYDTPTVMCVEPLRRQNDFDEFILKKPRRRAVAPQ